MDRSRLVRCAAIVAALIAAAALAASASASTKWADLRVVTHTGRTLAEFRQYTGPVDVSASRKADCFGPDNPSSGKRYRLKSADALGILKDASASDHALSPLLVSDAFVDDGFGLGLCSIGGFDTAGFSFWDLIRDHLVSSQGAQFTPVQNGDSILWYLTSGSEPSSGPRELALRAPASASPNDPFTVTAVRFTSRGKPRPAGGVGVFAGGHRLGTTSADGELRIRLGSSALLEAVGTPNDIPSGHVAVCVSADSKQCPDAHGKRIYGSSHSDRIHGTAGWDRIASRGGADVVNLRSGGRDRVSCGGGRDKVILDHGDRNDHIARSCERVLRR